MEETIHSELVVSEPKKITNRALLQELERKRAFLEAGCGVIGSAVIGVFIASNPLLLSAGLAVLGFGLKKIQKLSQIMKAVTNIRDNFEGSQEIDILTQLDVPEHGSLDLLVKFPSVKVIFGIALRSQGKATITYNENKNSLYIRNKNNKRGGFKAWSPDHIKRFNEQEYWLRKNQTWVFGSSSKDKRRPLTKLLVLTGETKLAEHVEKFYVNIGQERVLLLQNRASVYIMEERQLVPFIQSFLSQKSQ